MKKRKSIAEKVNHFIYYSKFADGYIIGRYRQRLLARFVRRVVREETKKLRIEIYDLEFELEETKIDLGI